MSTLLMIAHSQGMPYITNDPEVAVSVQIREEMKFAGKLGHIGTTMETQIRESIRPTLVVDFGGAVIVGWHKEEVELPDGSIFAFWPHQYSGLMEHLSLVLKDAEQEGFGVLMDSIFPVALSASDLQFLQRYLANSEERLSKENACHQQFYQAANNRIQREGSLTYTDPNRIPFKNLRLLQPASREVH